MEAVDNVEIGPHDVGFVKYADRDEWRDVQPVPQNDGPHPVTKISYENVFTDVFDYFRAVLATNELSERAFELTRDAATLNPANYTVWYFRRVLLKALEKDLRTELNYIAQVITEHPKNYQVWHHRQVVVQWLGDASQEKVFTESILEMDAKNYHAWQYRQNIQQEFGMWEGELHYINMLLESDIRNNSAWNQRYIVCSQMGLLQSEDGLRQEVDYTLDKIKVAPHNESSWNYLRGILQDRGLGSDTQVVAFCETFHADGCRSPYLLCFMVDYLREAGDASRAIQICDALAREHDTIRKEYWNYVARISAQTHDN